LLRCRNTFVTNAKFPNRKDGLIYQIMMQFRIKRVTAAQREQTAPVPEMFFLFAYAL